MTATRYWVDGHAQASIDPGLRALHYGDGVFETLCVRAGIVEYQELHWQRLRAGCERLRLAFTDWDGLRAEVRRAAHESSAAVIKVIMSRAAGVRGYRPDSTSGSVRLVSAQALPEWPQQYRHAGVRTRICDLRLGVQPLLAGIKHLNRLEQVLARAEWGDDYVEGLLLDGSGRVIEGTMSNVFLVHDSKLYTPRLNDCGVAGVMRTVVLDLATGLGFEPRRQNLTLADLERAEEVFVCNSLIGIWPVIEIAQRYSGRAGALTQALQRALADNDITGSGTWYSE